MDQKPKLSGKIRKLLEVNVSIQRCDFELGNNFFNKTPKLKQQQK
jgi:hypothetical protein